MLYRAVYLKRTNNTHEALCCWRSNASHAVTSTEVPRYQEIDVPNQAPTSLRSTTNADHAETSTNVHRYQEIDVPNQALTTPDINQTGTLIDVPAYQELHLRGSTPNADQSETTTNVHRYQELHLPGSTPNADQAETTTNVHRYQELQIPSQSLTSLRPAPNAERAETLTVVPRYQGLHLPCQGHTYATISPTWRSITPYFYFIANIVKRIVCSHIQQKTPTLHNLTHLAKCRESQIYYMNNQH